MHAFFGFLTSTTLGHMKGKNYYSVLREGKGKQIRLKMSVRWRENMRLKWMNFRTFTLETALKDSYVNIILTHLFLCL